MKSKTILRKNNSLIGMGLAHSRRLWILAAYLYEMPRPRKAAQWAGLTRL